jgi:predicted NBD/HSP70 family sugar kinase
MGEKADSELVRRQNRKLVLEALRHDGAMGRVELGRSTGLSPASITSIAGQLIQEGVIAEQVTPLGTPRMADANIAARRGRPVVKVALRGDATHVGAVRIAAHEIDLTIADFGGTLVARKRLDYDSAAVTRDSLSDTIIEAWPGFVASAGLLARDISRIGIAIQGVANTRNGSIAWSPVFRVRDIPMTIPIEAALDVPCSIANDTKMMAEGMVAHDRERFRGVAAVIFIGHGVGMAIVMNGKIYEGATGAAGEFGHVNHQPDGLPCRCGRKGCLEAYVADYGVLQLANLTDAERDTFSRGLPEENALDGIIDQARAGDARILEAFDRSGVVLGYGIARVIALFNPDRVILAGPGMKAAPFLEAGIARGLDHALVDALRATAKIEYAPFDPEIILQGVVSSLLASVDAEVFAPGTGLRDAVTLETA